MTDGAGPPAATPTVVLATHLSPRIHGQSEIASALVERAAGWAEVRLLAVNTPYSLDRESLVRFSVRKVGRMFRHLRSTTSAVRASGARVVIVTPSFHAGPFLKDAFVICALSALTRARVVAWVHMDPARLELERKPWWYRRVALFALDRVSCWVATSPTLLDLWPAFIPRQRRHSILNGLAVPQGLPVRTGERAAARVCYVSSMEHAKGWTDLVAAAEQLCDERPELEFHFYGPVGADSTPTGVTRRFASSPFSERIVWHGPVGPDAKWKVLVESDLFCFPSHTEQLPLAVLEAMICGLPVVATRVGAVGDAVVDGEGGWLVAPNAPEELARTIRDALSDPTRLLRFGEFNRARQEQLFSISRFGSDWERFLARVAA